VIDADTKKKLLAKCLHESTNRHIFMVVRANLIKMEQSRTVQPQLLANPQALRVTVQQKASAEGLNQAEINKQMQEMMDMLESSTL
jgi:hypothetical protein